MCSQCCRPRVWRGWSAHARRSGRRRRTALSSGRCITKVVGARGQRTRAETLRLGGQPGNACLLQERRCEALAQLAARVATFSHYVCRKPWVVRFADGAQGVHAPPLHGKPGEEAQVHKGAIWPWRRCCGALNRLVLYLVLISIPNTTTCACTLKVC